MERGATECDKTRSYCASGWSCESKESIEASEQSPLLEKSYQNYLSSLLDHEGYRIDGVIYVPCYEATQQKFGSELAEVVQLTQLAQLAQMDPASAQNQRTPLPTIDDFQTNIRQLYPRHLTLRNASRLGAYLCSTWVQSIPAVTKIVLCLLVFGAFVGMLGAAKYTSFCPHSIQTQHAHISRYLSTVRDTSSTVVRPGGASGVGSSSLSLSADAVDLDVPSWTNRPILLTLEATLPRLLFYPLISPSLGLSIMLIFAIYYLASSIEEHRGSIYLAHVLTVLSTLTLAIFLALYTMLASLYPPLVQSDQSWIPTRLGNSSNHRWFLFDTLPTCASSFLCVSGAEPIVLGLLFVEATVSNRTKRHLMGLSMGIPSPVYPFIMYLIFSLFWLKFNLGHMAGLIAGAMYAYVPALSLSPATQHRVDLWFGLYTPPPSQDDKGEGQTERAGDAETSEQKVADNPALRAIASSPNSSSSEEFSRYAARNAMATSAGSLLSQVGPAAWYSLSSALIPLAMTISPTGPYIDSVIRREMVSMWKLASGDPSSREFRERTIHITKSVGISAEEYAENYPYSTNAEPCFAINTVRMESSKKHSSAKSPVVYYPGIRLGADLIEAHGVGSLGAMLGGGRPFGSRAPNVPEYSFSQAKQAQQSQRENNMQSPIVHATTTATASVPPLPASGAAMPDSSSGAASTTNISSVDARNESIVVSTNLDEELVRIAASLQIDSTELARRTSELVRFGYKEQSALRALYIAKGDITQAQELLQEIGTPTTLDPRVAAGLDPSSPQLTATRRSLTNGAPNMYKAQRLLGEQMVSDDEDDEETLPVSRQDDKLKR